VTDEPQNSWIPDEGSEFNWAETVAKLCREAIAGMKLDLEVSAKKVEDSVFINLTGQDRPILLSNSAVLLNSLEYILNKVFRTGKDAELASIVLDSNDYRQHRESELVLLAKMAADRVKAQRRPLTLQPMVPKERRLIHLALAKIEGVRSESEGEGDKRSITIYPL
jgi:spoIIIJ-associated protein